MLRIYPVSLEMVRDVREFADAIQRFDGDLARQLRRASMSVVLNLSEGSGSRGRRRRMRYEDALGSARETLAGLGAGHAAGYLGPVPEAVRARFNHIIGTLVRLGQGAA